MLVRAMATKKKASKKRSAPAKKKPATVAAGKRGAGKTPKKAVAAKKRAVAPKKGARKAAAPKKAARKAAAPKKAARKAVAPKKVARKKAAPARVAPPKKAAGKKAAPAKPSPIHRRDGAGHLDAGYAAMLREKSLEGRVRDPDEAFIGRSGRSKDNLAEQMGEAWVETATSGEDENEEVFNQEVPEDDGGPFVGSTAGQEFADGTDASNPKGAKREPFPKT
jgi:hypothetical protein